MTPPLLAVLLSLSAVTLLWWSIPTFAKPTLPFGVRIPHERRTEAAIATARDTFTGRILGLAVAAAVLSLPLTVLTSLELALPILTTALVLADTVVYVLAHRFLRTAKTEGGWYDGTRQGVTVDLSLRRDPVRIPWRWLAPAVLVLAVTAVLAGFTVIDAPATLPTLDGVRLGSGERVAASIPAILTPVFTQAGLCLAVALAAVGLTRTRPELDASRPAASARRHRHYLRALSVLLFGGAALANLTMLGIALRLWEWIPASVVTALAVFAPLAALLPLTLWFQVRVGHGGHRLPPEPGEAAEDTGLVQRDDDRHWHLGGFVYINPDDPALLVPQRIGMANWTLNLGRPAGQAIATALVAGAVAVAVLAGLGVIDLPEKQGF